MKSKQKKQEDLVALTEQFKNSSSALVMSFSGLTVERDQQLRNDLRETGATYKVVKNTLARIAVKDTPFEEATEYFNGVTSVAWTSGEAVELSKVVTKYLKEYDKTFELKGGVVDGKLVGIDEIKAIASLPSKDELIAKLLFLLNSPAQRTATVLQAVPRDLVVVLQQISELPEGSTEAAEGKESNDAPAEKNVEDAKVTEESPAEEKADEAKKEPPAEEKSEE